MDSASSTEDEPKQKAVVSTHDSNAHDTILSSRNTKANHTKPHTPTFSRMSNISPGHFFNNLATKNNTGTKELEEKSNSSNERSMELSARSTLDSFNKSDRDMELMEPNDTASNSFE